MKTAIVEVLKRVEVKDWNEIKKGDLFYHSNSGAQLNRAVADGIDSPDDPSLALIKSEKVEIIRTQKQ